MVRVCRLPIFSLTISGNEFVSVGRTMPGVNERKWTAERESTCVLSERPEPQAQRVNVRGIYCGNGGAAAVTGET